MEIGWIIELDDGKIYRKVLYLMVKPWFPVDFPLNQSSEWKLDGNWMERMTHVEFLDILDGLLSYRIKMVKSEEMGTAPGLAATRVSLRAQLTPRQLLSSSLR
jgi:hypothetical protein